eukprot:TRINITY_DN25903_c0_g1_i3.p1 TRINITY_DN25903_c0_g1~~TRINITY_DN25903_c0_g1_i3.p1  ORF type:complete len:331 (+),score=65.48 TRINITY_DN25903_c0_g1_i3:65-994(+)
MVRCCVPIYDCLRAWCNPQSIAYGPFRGRRRRDPDVHEYYYFGFLQGGLTAKPSREWLQQLKDCKEDLRSFIDENNCHPILVRLAWYPLISWADLIQMASAVAVEVAGGPVVDMKYGRVEAKSPEDCAKPDSREGFRGNAGLPDAKPPYGCGASTAAEHLRNVFTKKMGFTDQEIVALSGVHTIGRAFKERSGTCPFGYGDANASKYTKSNAVVRKDGKVGCGMAGGAAWTKNWLTFDNAYFTSYTDAMKDRDLLWFPTDEALHTDAAFKQTFRRYADDQAAFFDEYAKAHKKLSELGAKFEPPEGVTI